MSVTAQIEAAAPSDQHCIAITPGALSESKQGHHVFEGISAESAGARALCMHVISIPPGGRARAHLHEDHESAVYMVEGEVICWYGDRLQHRFTVRAGEMAYIPAGVPHLPVNANEHEPVTCIVARTDPNEQESVVVLPELDALAHTYPRPGVVVELDSVRR
ncbi:MAG: cupin domain-containing protein [Actinomycetota bacterium]|nr:cupin domain-containing protein [Actinomycetota bacterium]